MIETVFGPNTIIDKYAGTQTEDLSVRDLFSGLSTDLLTTYEAITRQHVNNRINGKIVSLNWVK